MDMTKIDKRYIGDEQIGSEQMELLNNSTFQGRNAAGTSSIDLFKVDTIDTLQFLKPINLPAAALNPSEAVRKQELDIVSALLSNRHFEFNNVSIATSSTSVYSTALTLVTPSLALGDYRLDIHSLFGISSNTRLMNYQVIVNGVVDKQWLMQAPAAAGRYPVIGFMKLTGISGIQTIELKFKLNTSGATVTILESTAELYQVGT